jgi:hypothetical protein
MTAQQAGKAVTGGHGRGPRGRLATLYSGVQSCAIPGCARPIDPSRLMCRCHWYTVPKELRDRVWATWRSGQDAYSREHQDAVRQAISAVMAALAEAGLPGQVIVQ